MRGRGSEQKKQSYKRTLRYLLREQMLHLIKGQSTVDQLSWSAHGHVVSRFGLGRQGRDLRGVPCQTGVVKPCSGDVAVREALSPPSSPSHSDDYHLLIAHTLGCLQTVNPDVTEVGCENLAALSQSLRGYDQHQDAGWLEPAIGVAQERLLGATTVSRPQCPIVRWIQI